MKLASHVFFLLSVSAAWTAALVMVTFPLQKGRDFPDVTVAKLAAGEWHRPRATTVGEVVYVDHEEDGDIHVKLVDGDKYIILEIIPELPLPKPKVGQRIKVCGIVRYDAHHKHYELHPVISWEKEKK